MMDPYDPNDTSVQRHTSFSNNTLDPTSLSNTTSIRDELFLQCHIHQELLSPTPHPRSGSFQYPSHSPATEHQAEPQPYASIHSTPQSATFQTSFPINGVEMQRGGSHASRASMASQYSEPSSDGQFGYQRHRHSQQQSPFSPFEYGQQQSSFSSLDEDDFFGDEGSQIGSQGSNALMYSCHHLETQEHVHGTTVWQDPILFDLLQPKSVPACSTDISTGSKDTSASDIRFWPQYGHGTTGGDGSMDDLGMDTFTKADRIPILLNTNISSMSLLPSHQRTERFDRRSTHPINQIALTSPNTTTDPDPRNDPYSPFHSSSTSPHPSFIHGKRRRVSLSPSSSSETITGHVLSSGKFKCSKPDCQDLRFGRQADFRRHCNNVHARKKTEYFCTVNGCPRSSKPIGRSKGRSFGTRKDKMKEHVRTVHGDGTLEDKKRRVEVESDEEDEGSDRFEKEDTKQYF